MKVYLVKERHSYPGKILAVMTHENEATLFANFLEKHEDTPCEVFERTLIYGQPSIRGYNP
jgi:hypothetical protein